jgi:hypothetical protein
MAIATPSDLTGRDLGNGGVTVSWSFTGNISALGITFDVYSSTDPLNPLHTLRAGNLTTTSATFTGFGAGGTHYFVVVARDSATFSFPSSILPLFVEPVLAPVVTTPGSTRAEEPAGVGFPFGIDATGGVFTQGGDPLLRSKVLQLLLTSIGERVNLPEYGTRLRDVVFDPNNEILLATTEFLVTRAFQRFLADEIHLDRVSVQNQAGDAQLPQDVLQVEITYARKSDLQREQLRIGLPIP